MYIYSSGDTKYIYTTNIISYTNKDHKECDKLAGWKIGADNLFIYPPRLPLTSFWSDFEEKPFPLQ